MAYKDPEYKKKYYLANKEIILKQKKEYVNNNKEKIKEQSKKWYENNKEKKLKKVKKWRNDNKEKVKIYDAFRSKNNINRKLSNILRTRIRICLKKKYKSKKTIELLGCTIEQLWKHLEKTFKPGMIRENHGLWHIDHIKPCASFDLTKPEEQAKCFHYTNLQALWAHENLSKGNKYEE